MRCKKHPTDLSSGVGVCASCLRERLLAIVAAQSCRKIDPPAPLAFPRSVSPYISRRKSDIIAGADDTWQLHGFGRRFYSTPHVGPTGSVKVEVKEEFPKRKGGRRFSSLFNWGGLFKSKSMKLDFDSCPISDAGIPSVDPCSDSPSWFSSIIPGRRKKAVRTLSVEDGVKLRQRRSSRNRDRGMSPARFFEEEDAHCYGGSSGYSSESSQGWRQTPRRTPASMRRGGGRPTGSANYASNLSFCLSPLVRASPNQRQQQKGIPPEMVAAGESRVPANSAAAAAAFFGKNRSRKLADLGRYSYNPTH